MKSVRFNPKALAELAYWVHNDIKIYDKIWELLKDISRNGAAKGIGKPERLKHKKYWSRRITDEHRLIYDVVEKYIYVFSCKGHYEDK